MRECELAERRLDLRREYCFPRASLEDEREREREGGAIYHEKTVATGTIIN